MSFMDFLKKNLMIFFIAVTCITVTIAILGSNYDHNATFGYEAFYSPIIFGALSVLPSIVLYSKRELTFKEVLVRRILHFVLLEAVLLGFGYKAGLLNSSDIILSFALSVFIIYVLTTTIQWIIDSRTAKEINEGLKRMQS